MPDTLIHPAICDIAVVPDLLRPGLRLVLCGTAPSRASFEAQAYYAHPGNIFWKTLHEVGLTPSRFRPKDYPQLFDLGIGLTDLNKREWGADAELTPAGFDRGSFIAKMALHRPRLIAFDSKFAAGQYFLNRTISYGLQSETLSGIPLWVVPSTSGRARRFFDLAPWQALANATRSLSDEP